MAKLKLDIAQLEVESFSIADAFGRDGTVHGRVVEPNVPIHQDPSYDYCGGGGGNTVGTCIGPTYCCGATGGSNPVCIGPTYCCNPTANTGCCPPPTGGCPGTAYYHTCGVSCPADECIP